MDSEKVRYLSREQRAHYLVKADERGLLCWAKNGERIDTTTEFKDSENGIVEIDDEEVDGVPPGDEAPLVRTNTDSSNTFSTPSASSVSSDLSGTERADRYINDKTGLRRSSSSHLKR